MFNIVLNVLSFHVKNIKPKWNDVFGKLNFSWTQIRDGDSYSDSNSSKNSFGLRNQALIDYLYKNTPIFPTKIYFEVPLWRHFHVVALSTWHS